MLLLDDVTCKKLVLYRDITGPTWKENFRTGILFAHHAGTPDVLQLKPLRATRVDRKACVEHKNTGGEEAACGCGVPVCRRASKRGPRTL